MGRKRIDMICWQIAGKLLADLLAVAGTLFFNDFWLSAPA